MDPLLDTAIKAARIAGEIIVRASRNASDIVVGDKGNNDLVTSVDEAAEQAIIATIRSRFESHAILAEETGEQTGRGYTWIVDPLDGTTNFIHGYPQYAVSIAVAHEGRTEHAVVYDPVRPELFTASRGRGAHLYGMPIHVSSKQDLRSALLGTGFPFKSQENLDVYIETFRALFPRSRGVRRAGAASLDLAWVAAGRLDGFWEFGLMAWDMAAGALLIEEAGGRVGDLSGGKDFLLTGNIVAGTPGVFDEIMQTISQLATRHLRN